MTCGPDDGDEPSGAVLSRGSRRRLLRSIVNVGLGAGVANLATGVLATEVSIVYGLAWTGDGEPERLTREVPRAWYEGLQLAFDVQRAVVDSDVPGIVGAFVVPGDYGDPASRLEVDVVPDVDGLSELRGLLARIDYAIDYVRPTEPEFGPETVDHREVGRTIELDDGQVPGGALGLAAGNAGTLAPAVYGQGGRRFFATSNHVYGDEGTLVTEHRGEPLSLFHEDGRTRIGSVVRGYPESDLVLAVPAGGYTPASRIDGNASPVVGHFTKAGLADLSARGEPLEKVGGIGGHASGPIEGIGGVTCYYGDACRWNQLKWGSRTAIASGDSGSVSYHQDPERPNRLLVASFNNARTWWPGSDFTWGTAAYHVHERLGVHF